MCPNCPFHKHSLQFPQLKTTRLHSQSPESRPHQRPLSQPLWLEAARSFPNTGTDAERCGRNVTATSPRCCENVVFDVCAGLKVGEESAAQMVLSVLHSQGELQCTQWQGSALVVICLNDVLPERSRGATPVTQSTHGNQSSKCSLNHHSTSEAKNTACRNILTDIQI